MTDIGREARKAAILAYGGRCACCGDGRADFKLHGRSWLELDHIFGKGHEFYKTMGLINSTTYHAWALYRWLQLRGWPQGFRVLCRACNISMRPGELFCEHCKYLKGMVIPESLRYVAA